MIGKRFGRLIIVERCGRRNKSGHGLWRCKCDCGGEKIVTIYPLQDGTTKSCGCLQREAVIRHGESGVNRTPTYRSWQNMIARCTQPANPAFKHYRKRGITVCDHWRDYLNFKADMGERPEGLTLDRINNDGNYEPGNCRWATRQEQANNRITNLWFDYKGKAYTLADLARETGVSKETLRHRLVRNSKQWTVEDAINTPVRKYTRY